MLWVVATVCTEARVTAVSPLDFGIDATCVAVIQVTVPARVDITMRALLRSKRRGRVREVFAFVTRFWERVIAMTLRNVLGLTTVVAMPESACCSASIVACCLVEGRQIVSKRQQSMMLTASVCEHPTSCCVRWCPRIVQDEQSSILTGVLDRGTESESANRTVSSGTWCVALCNTCVVTTAGAVG